MLDDSLKRDDYITLDKEAIIILKNKIRELNSPLIVALLRYHSGLNSYKLVILNFFISKLYPFFLGLWLWTLVWIFRRLWIW